MSVEEDIPFLERVGQNEDLKDSPWAVPDKSRRRVLRFSLILNAVLSVLCILLSGRLIQISSQAGKQNIGDKQTAEPYCEDPRII